jgi:surface protein
VGYFQCHYIGKTMISFVTMFCLMCVLTVLVHSIISYSIILIYFVISYIIQSGMFRGASAFNGNITAWDTSSVTSFVSQ